MSRDRTAAFGILVLMVIVGGTISCTTPPPAASNAVPPPASAPTQAPVVWVALGGGETLAGGAPEDAGGAWTQRVFSRLPPTARLYNLATPGASVLEASSTQLAALEAETTAPTVVSIWFGSDEPATTGPVFARQLRQLVDEVGARGASCVVLIARRASDARARYRFDREIEAVATETGSSFVAVTTLGRNASEPAAQAAIADAIAPFVV